MNGRVYDNVFRLFNYCDFPKDKKEREEFYFDLRNAPSDNLCMNMDGIQT
mgnify:CR=1 FL=1